VTHPRGRVSDSTAEDEGRRTRCAIGAQNRGVAAGIGDPLRANAERQRRQRLGRRASPRTAVGDAVEEFLRVAEIAGENFRPSGLRGQSWKEVLIARSPERDFRIPLDHAPASPPPLERPVERTVGHECGFDDLADNALGHFSQVRVARRNAERTHAADAGAVARRARAD